MRHRNNGKRGRNTLAMIRRRQLKCRIAQLDEDDVYWKPKPTEIDNDKDRFYPPRGLWEMVCSEGNTNIFIIKNPERTQRTNCFLKEKPHQWMVSRTKKKSSIDNINLHRLSRKKRNLLLGYSNK